MRRALIVMRREWMCAFESPVAYVTIVTFVLAAAGLFFFIGYPVANMPLPGLWRGGQADLQTLFAWLPLLLVFLVPALTMGSWAQERSEGTDELLASYPLRVGEVVLGKFLAVWSLTVLLLAATILPVAISVARLGPLDWSTVQVGLIGAWMLAATYVALALCVSATTGDQLVAYIFGVILLGGLWLTRMFVPVAPSEFAPFLAWLSPGTHFLESAARGVFDLRDAIYFGLFVFAGLSWNAVLVERRSGTGQRFGMGTQGLLSLGLTLAILAFGNLTAGRHCGYRKDLSEDQLYGVSSATRSILSELEDTLLTTVYFSGQIRSGEWALRKARLEAMLEEYAAAASGRLRIVYADPSRSTEALSEARELGIQARQASSMSGTSVVNEPVYLGLSMRYRGREEILPLLDPGSFEVSFASAVNQLVRERRPVVGWWRPAPEWDRPQVGGLTFQAARDAIAQRAEVRNVDGLEFGRSVPAAIDVLCVVRPTDVHPRAAFEIDQYVQAGGKLLLCIDDASLSARGVGARQASGLEALMDAWAARPTGQHVWDPSSSGLHIEPVLTPKGRVRHWRQVEMPLYLDLDQNSVLDGLSATAGIVAAHLCWAQPIPPLEPPNGVLRFDLLQSSEDAYRTDLTHTIVSEKDLIAVKTASLNALGKGRAYTLATALTGHFPSAFGDGVVPAAAAAEDSVLAEGAVPAEDANPSKSEARVVIFGDADWVRDGEQALYHQFFTPANRALLLNLIDWLTLDEALLSLRARAPRDRSLVDFDEEERRAAGVLGSLQSASIGQVEHRLGREQRAASRARRRRMLAMMVPVGITLTLLLALGIAWNIRESRRLAWGSGA
ncbi:MAG: ABC-type uncharacterized transport system involved in gliding motility auxiliary subunit [Planctomycetota bacterium]|jgi:ABC-type uncharacterized transport system involved in gliding motility auxiliary subunit/ABC-type transport system involved in multi-copper enzyme maturation permease subunit